MSESSILISQSLLVTLLRFAGFDKKMPQIAVCIVVYDESIEGHVYTSTGSSYAVAVTRYL